MSQSDKSSTPEAGGDSAKRQGDKLGIGTSTPSKPGVAKASGDSPKRHGDKLEHAVNEAAKK